MGTAPLAGFSLLTKFTDDTNTLTEVRILRLGCKCFLHHAGLSGSRQEARPCCPLRAPCGFGEPWQRQISRLWESRTSGRRSSHSSLILKPSKSSVCTPPPDCIFSPSVVNERCKNVHQVGPQLYKSLLKVCTIFLLSS